jgi:hypothetical protein
MGGRQQLGLSAESGQNRSIDFTNVIRPGKRQTDSLLD